MIFLLDMVIFQFAMLVYQRVIHMVSWWKSSSVAKPRRQRVQRALPHEVACGFAFDPMLCNVALAMNSHSEFPQDLKREGLPYFYSIL